MPMPVEACHRQYSPNMIARANCADNPSGSDPELLYILSPSFSGSTLLTCLLAAHPEIATVGELKASAMGDVNTYRCSCGALLVECRFWRQVKEETITRGLRFSFDDFGSNFNCGSAFFRRLVRLGSRAAVLSHSSSFLLRALPSCRNRLIAILGQNRVLISVITALQNARVFLDGSKDPERLNQLLISRHWRIKVIHLIRDGRGVVNSYMKHHGVDVRCATAEWLRTARDCARIAGKVSRRNVVTIKYEDICGDARAAIDRICAFGGLAGESSSWSRVSPQIHILGNAMRLDKDRPIELDDKWKTQFIASDLRIFNTVAGAYNRSRGYT
jgi:Sulfotransferase family